MNIQVKWAKVKRGGFFRLHLVFPVQVALRRQGRARCISEAARLSGARAYAALTCALNNFILRVGPATSADRLDSLTIRINKGREMLKS